MDKETRKEIAKEVVNLIFRDVRPGTAFWRLNEVFRKKLLNDPEGKVFNDQFADGLARFKQQLESSSRKWLLVSYISGLLLLSLLGGFAIPISIPYIDLNSVGNNPKSGLLEIVLIAFLIANLNLFISGSRSNLYRMFLRTFVEIRYGQEIRDFYLLRWRVDDISRKLDSEDYEGYVRKREVGRFRKVLTSMYAWTLLTIITAEVLLIALGVLRSFLSPAFGWLTYLIIGGLLIFFLYNFLRIYTAEWGDFYEFKMEEKD